MDMAELAKALTTSGAPWFVVVGLLVLGIVAWAIVQVRKDKQPVHYVESRTESRSEGSTFYFVVNPPAEVPKIIDVSPPVEVSALDRRSRIINPEISKPSTLLRELDFMKEDGDKVIIRDLPPET